ncbi:helix-turn-helix domain-containing protein [Virgibacillus dokdonensis]|uniref:helix-turn-helix domain-containing protein n=1 Tax=Virgibacillus dokdonensis TaxID=302167 RepID=UPI0015907388|nr:response regulator transcription factor [Virgibacillus dokdonensis]
MKIVTFLYDPSNSIRIKQDFILKLKEVKDVDFIKNTEMIIVFSEEKEIPNIYLNFLSKIKIPIIYFLGIEKLTESSIKHMVDFVESGNIFSIFIESNSNIFKDSLTFIHENMFNYDFKITDVGNEFHISPTYYSKLFKENVGMGFKLYVTKKRIEQARLLLEKDYSVTEVSNEVGYSNLSHFIKIFKKRVGLTPTQYKKKTIINGFTNNL